jgi:hypothetical protein
MKKNQEIALSCYAESELSSNWWDYFTVSVLITALSFALCFILALSFKSAIWFLYWLGFSLITWLFIFKKNGKKWKKGRQTIFSRNEADYNLSLRLKNALEKISSVKSSNFPVTDQAVGSQWKPFRVEHFVSNSLKAEITGCGGLFVPFNGFAKGVAIPNLLDSSSVLFLKNNGKTLRVIIPSSRTTQEMFAKTIGLLLPDRYGSFVYRTLQNFSVSDENLLGPLSHPEFIDMLDSSCELPLEQRPEVIVKGQQIQKGVAIATTLGVGRKEKIFLPSGFLQKIIDTAHSIAGIERKSLKPAEVMQ